MEIEFQALGVTLDAVVDYIPPGPQGGITDESPPDPEELEFVGLFGPNGEDAHWLLDSAAGAEIRAAALTAAREEYRSGGSAFDEP